MNKQSLKDTLGWGVVLWFIGYVLGIILFAMVPPQLIGWVIMPIGIYLTIWVLCKKITLRPFLGYLPISISWAVLAVVLDYFFLVKLFNPADGYYKLDVYLYYATTLALPLVVGYVRQHSKAKV